MERIVHSRVRHGSRRRRLLVAPLMVLLLALSTVPASAGPPQQFEDPEFIILFPDVNVERSVFINITAGDFCEWLESAEPFFAWLDAFFLYQEYLAFLDDGGSPDDFFIQPPPEDPGPPPEEPDPLPAIDPVTITENHVKFSEKEVFGVGSIDEELYIEMWEFDEGVDPSDPSTLIGPCADIQDQLDEGAEPWATGTVRFHNNFSKAYGENIRAVVSDADDTSYAYHNSFHINGNCRFDPEAGPACLVDTSQLREINGPS